MPTMPTLPSVVADFTLTFDEFAEGYKLQRRRKRFLSGPPERSRWVGCAWIGGLFALLVVLAIVATIVTGHNVTKPDGKTTIESDSPIVAFLIALLPWPIIAGALWLIVARSILERRMVWRVVFLVMVIGAGMALSAALAPTPASQPTPPTSVSSTILSLLPLLVGIAGAFLIMLDMLRRVVHVAWQGQPQLRQPFHVEADEKRLLVQTPLSSTHFTWPAVVSFSESERVFLVSFSALTFHVIPKRALAGGAVEALRALLTAQAVNADDRRQGLPVIP